MTVEFQQFINVALGVSSAVFGWLARELWTAVKDLKEDLTKLSVELPKTYVTRDDYRSDLKEIKDMLGKIFDRLDNKADK
jgi:hypothetical protein